MKAGTQHGDSDAILRAMAGFGVNHICSRLPSAKLDAAWSVESLTRLRERVESFGLTLDMVPLPLSSNEISRSENAEILLGKEPDRDRQIDDMCQMLRNTAARRDSVGQVQPDIPGRPAHGADARPRPRAVQHVRLCHRKAGPAADDRRSSRCGSLLGAHHLFPQTRGSRRRRSTRSGSRAIRRIRECRRGRGGAASKRSSDRSRA